MPDDFIIIAHRGASGDYPENTLLAFRKALEAGATWLELDVQLSSDGRLVVIHDETLERTTNGRGAVGDHSLAQLRALDAGQGEKIPLLSEVLDLAAGRAVVNVELKGVGTAEPVAQLLAQEISRGRWPAEKLLVSSLLPAEIIRFAEQQPNFRMAPIADCPDRRVWELADRLGAWSVHVEKAAVTPDLVAASRRAGKKLLVYTVNERGILERLKALGVAGVFTDRPELYSP